MSAPQHHETEDNKDAKLTCDDCNFHRDMERLRQEAKSIVKLNEHAFRHLATEIVCRPTIVPEELIITEVEIKDILNGVPLYKI